MDTIVSVLIIAAAPAVTFLLAHTNEAQAKGKRTAAGELDYLCTYRGILQEAAQVERKLDQLNRHLYLTTLDISCVKMQTRDKISKLLNEYKQGQITGQTAQNDLNELNARMDVLLLSVVAA